MWEQSEACSYLVGQRQPTRPDRRIGECGVHFDVDFATKKAKQKRRDTEGGGRHTQRPCCVALHCEISEKCEALCAVTWPFGSMMARCNVAVSGCGVPPVAFC